MSATLSARRAEELIAGFPRVRVGVVGDVSLDIEISGRVRRLSPEAPVPVVENPRERAMLGCAGNVAHNILTLGAGASVFGVVGQDAHAETLRDLLSHFYQADARLLPSDDRPTTTKTRVMARYQGQSQHIGRIDREERAPISECLRKRLLEELGDVFSHLDVLIIEDYGKGVVTAELVHEVLHLRQMHIDLSRRVPVVVDPKNARVEMYRGVDWITPNHHEVTAATEVEAEAPEHLEEAGRQYLSRAEATFVLITRGGEGMSLFAKGQERVDVPANAREVFDVTGCGDTVVAALGVALAAGASPGEAMVLANLAGGVKAAKMGLSPVSADELRADVARLP